MSSNGAGVVCLHALHVHTVYTWEQSHRNKKPPQEPTLTETRDIWSFAQCINRDTGQCQRPLKQRPTTAQFRTAFANPFLCAID